MVREEGIGRILITIINSFVHEYRAIGQRRQQQQETRYQPGSLWYLSRKPKKTEIGLNFLYVDEELL